MSATGPHLRAGETIAGTKYRVVKSLGAGGMGVVYQVVKPPNIGGVLKVMSTELTKHHEHRLRFFDEVRILAQLDHPNIVKVFDYDALADGTPFYVMELLSGRTVRDVLYTMGRVPPRVAYEITRQLLEALQAAHTHEVPVIHRDIKPENIFLHAPRHGEPVVKLIDFGVSAVADRSHDGTFVGTWSYAAPEQIRGERPTPATDLYAAGLVLYEMLAGRGPFDHHDDWRKISEAQLHETPAPVSTLAPWVPPSIVSLIETALAKDPSVRPRDAYAFAERLYELEWASDGNDPRDFTAEGPSADAAMARVNAHRTRPGERLESAARARPDGAIVVAGNGPLSRVLSTVTASPSSKNMAAAKPASDRLGDVPLIGVPVESVRIGPTWQGVGEPTVPPDANALLEGLNAQPRKPAAKRERGSNPEPDTGDRSARPRQGQVVIRAGAGAVHPQGEQAPTTPRQGPVRVNPPKDITAETLDAPVLSGPIASAPPVSARDTFSSQASDTRMRTRSRANLFFLAATLLLSGLVVAVVVVARGGKTSTATESARNGRRPETSATTAAAQAPSGTSLPTSTSASAKTAAADEPIATAATSATTATSAPSATGTPRAGSRPGSSAAGKAAAAPTKRVVPEATAPRSDYMRGLP